MDRLELLEKFRRQEGRVGDVSAYLHMQTNHMADMATSQAIHRIMGEVPGVPIGMVFRSFYELMVVGIHGSRLRDIYAFPPPNGGRPLAISLVLREAPRNLTPKANIVVYGGEGGNPYAKEPGVTVQENDQEMILGNAALARSIHVENPIRLIKETDDGYRYEGVYQAIGWESEIIEGSGAIAYNFTLRRMSMQ